MAERKVTNIVWRQLVPDEIELVYSDGHLEHIPGTHADAAEMAKSAGMNVVATAVGTFRWVPEGIPKASKWKTKSRGRVEAAKKTMTDDPVAIVLVRYFENASAEPIELVRAYGGSERVEGTAGYAAELAQKAGLKPVPTTDATRLWVKDPAAWNSQ